MSEQLSSSFQITIREFEILQKAVLTREKKLRADAEKCDQSYTGKVTTAAKAREYRYEAIELNELLAKIAQEFS